MSDTHEHLDLPTNDKSFKREIHGFGRYDPQKNIKDFAKKQIKNLDNIGKEFTKIDQFPDYNQELVFKVKTSQKVNENEFRKRLNGVDCETITSSVGKNAEWIVSTSDSEFAALKDKINVRVKNDKVNFIDGISDFKKITFQDKLGERLLEEPLGSIEKARIVISLSKKESDHNDEKLKSSVRLIENLAKENDLGIYDKLITKNICLILLDCTLHFAKIISRIDIVEKIDRPPTFTLEKMVNEPIEIPGNMVPPNQNDHGILVMDSGIILHPLLESAVDQNDGIVGLPDRNREDERRHGTMVGGIALYGDIEERLSNKDFSADVWIYSSKVFYESNNKIIPDERLIEAKIKDGLRDIKEKFPRCRVVNISFGSDNKIMQEGKKQFELAVLIDDLAKEYEDTVFVISAGNIKLEHHKQYPNYLLADNPEYKIGDPATSIHAISVGAVQKFGDWTNQPSNLTKTGPGLNGMIKPDFVENGGGFNENIIVLNPNYGQRLFTLNSGTSFSAPKIANYFARLFNKFPKYDRNLVTALLISSAKIPEQRPALFPKIKSNTTADEWSKITSVYEM